MHGIDFIHMDKVNDKAEQYITDYVHLFTIHFGQK